MRAHESIGRRRNALETLECALHSMHTRVLGLTEIHCMVMLGGQTAKIYVYGVCLYSIVYFHRFREFQSKS